MSDTIEVTVEEAHIQEHDEALKAEIEELRSRIALMSQDHPDFLDDLQKLGGALYMRFESHGMVEDIDAAISVRRQAVALAPEGHPHLPMTLMNLGSSLTRRFERLGEVRDIDAAISALQCVVDLTPAGHADLPTTLMNLGGALTRRFERLGEVRDIDTAITTLRRAIDQTPDGHANMLRALAGLGTSSMRRFERLGDVRDIDTAIITLQRAVNLIPEGHPDLPPPLMSLGLSLTRRFERLGGLKDIDTAISVLQRAVNLTPEGHPSMPGILLNLGGSLIRRFERLGEARDMDTAITVLQRAVDLTPEGHPILLLILTTLGFSLTCRFERLGEVKDSDTAVTVLQLAVNLTPEGHPILLQTLTNLGFSLMRRFEYLGLVKDIDAAITALQRAVDLTSEGHPSTPVILLNLGISLTRRSERLDEVKDSDAAITALQRAVDLTSEGHPSTPGILLNLGGSLIRRFERLGEVKDMDAAITTLQRAVDLTPEGHPNVLLTLTTLGFSLTRRFERLMEVKDSDTAVTVLQRAVNLTPEGHPILLQTLTNLGYSLLRRLEHLGGIEGIDEAITTLQRAVDLTSEGYPSTPVILLHLGDAWLIWFRRSNNRSYFALALKTFMAASTESFGRPFVRLIAAVKVTTMLAEDPDSGTNSEALLLAHSRILEVIPHVVWLGYGVDRRYNESAKIGSLIAAAASAAIANNMLQQAVEWLEAGRSQVWTQVLSLREPVDDLESQHQTLAQSFRSLQARLQQSWGSSGMNDFHAIMPADHSSSIVDAGAEKMAVDHRNLVAQYEELLGDIRKQSGFEDFLRPKRLSALRMTPELADGPVVFINVHSSRCDALILSPSGAVSMVPLPELSLELARQLQSLWSDELKSHRLHAPLSTLNRDGACSSASIQPGLFAIETRHSDRVREGTQFENLLGHLWTRVVCPILDAVNSLETIHDDHLPHITWCPTGPLMQLPLHAAGIYSDPDGPRAFDSVVSSYTPSLSVLKRCSEGAAIQQITPSVLVVTQPATPGQFIKLPGTVDEGRRIQRLLKESKIEEKLLNDDEAGLASVREVMDRYPWVHLACHGSQKTGDATRSAFHLYDGPLSLSELMGTVADNAEIAFLSACQTATGDKTNPEESAHLAAGMLAVGFKGVVATMWTIQDKEAPIVVEAYYKSLIELRRTGAVPKGQTGAAYALHEAVRVLREQVGERSFASWAPFVHFGV